MESSVSRRLGVATVAGSLLLVCVLVVLILVGLDGIRGWWYAGSDLVVDAADWLRVRLFGVE